MVRLTRIFNTSVLITHNLLLSKCKHQSQFRYHRFVYFILHSVIFDVIRPLLHPDIRNQAIGMLSAGMLACNVARRIGVHKNTIFKLAWKHRLRGLTRPVLWVSTWPTWGLQCCRGPRSRPTSIPLSIFGMSWKGDCEPGSRSLPLWLSWSTLEEEWAAKPQERVLRLIVSTRARCGAIVAAEGEHTAY